MFSLIFIRVPDGEPARSPGIAGRRIHNLMPVPAQALLGLGFTLRVRPAAQALSMRFTDIELSTRYTKIARRHDLLKCLSRENLLQTLEGQNIGNERYGDNLPPCQSS